MGWAVGSQYMHGQMVMDILNVVHVDSSNSNKFSKYCISHFFKYLDSLEDFNIVFELVFHHQGK